MFFKRPIEPASFDHRLFSTLNIAILAHKQINVDTLLRYKPEPKDLFYPAELTYEPAGQGETQARHRDRDQRSMKRKVAWENECEAIKLKGLFADGITWVKVDTKVKSLIYLCIRAEGQRIYHKRFPHSNLNTISALVLSDELSLILTQPRNTTYDRFLLFTCKQNDEKLENFHRRLKALGAHCRLETAEDSLINYLFIAFTNNNAEIQSELLTETRTPFQVLQYALKKREDRRINERLRADSEVRHS